MAQHLCRPLDSREKLLGAQPQRGCDVTQCSSLRLVASGLNISNSNSRNAGLLGKLFLRQAGGLTGVGDFAAEFGASIGGWCDSFHACIVAICFPSRQAFSAVP